MISLTEILDELVEELDEKYKTKGNLGKWLRQKWVDISRKDKGGKHPPCGASTKTKRVSGKRMAKGMPGKPPPVPTSKIRSSG